MGTRSHTYFIEKWEDTTTKKMAKETVAKMYKQYDGYPSGYGKELATFLVSRKLVNGIGGNPNVFNGMGCCAAQVVDYFKSGAGGIYLRNTKRDDNPVDFVYEVVGYFDPSISQENDVILRVFSGGKRKKIFEGTPQEFLQSKISNE